MMTVFVLTRQMDFEGEQVLDVFISEQLALATHPRAWGRYGPWRPHPTEGADRYWTAEGDGERLLLTEFDLKGLIEELP